MTSQELISLYSERKKTYQDQIPLVSDKALLISWARVFAALLILLLIYFGLQHALLWWAVLPTVILYAVLVSAHEKLKARKALLENLVIINDAEIKAQHGDHTAFADGSEFIDAQHPYAVDLDIFGKGSVFQRFNRTCTEPGKERLASMLAQPLTSASDIHQRQEAVSELSGNVDFRQLFQATGMSSAEKKDDQRQLLHWLTIPSIVYGKRSYTMLLIAAPVLSFLTLTAGIIFDFYAPFIIVALTQWGIIGFHARRVAMLQEYIGSKKYLLEKFAGHLNLLHAQKFETALLQTLNRESLHAHRQIDVLSSRSRALNLRMNFFASILLNSTVLYDLQCVYRLEKWREENREHLGRWLETVREADALNSMAGFRFNHPSFVLPEIAESSLLIMEEAGHPLLDEAHMVRNTVGMDENSKVWIVTGANMAGKSTFLRTVGINTVLALTGSVVCANRMLCPILEVHTGMRTTDSINENQSYFFAELLRLQKIVTQLKAGKKTLVLLDEILKGTNSEDKLTGSRQLLRKLVNHQCLTMVATHDLALGEMEQEFPERVVNYHFETFTKGDTLMFDYKLKRGVTTGKNATFLMRKMEIID